MWKSFIIILLILFSLAATGQNRYEPDAKLHKQLEDSRNLRITMKPDLADAGLTRWYHQTTSTSLRSGTPPLQRRRNLILYFYNNEMSTTFRGSSHFTTSEYSLY